MEALRVRVEELYRRVADLERTQPAVIAAEVRALRDDIADMREQIKDVANEQKASRRASYAAVLSVAGGIAIWALTAWQAWGG